MDQPLLDTRGSQFLQVAARFAEPDGAKPHLSNQELLACQMVQRDASCDQIAAGLSLFDVDIVVASQCFDGFCFHESHLAVDLSRLAKRALALAVAVAFQPAAGDCPYLGDGRRFAGFLFGYVDSH